MMVRTDPSTHNLLLEHSWIMVLAARGSRGHRLSSRHGTSNQLFSPVSPFQESARFGSHPTAATTTASGATLRCAGRRRSADFDLLARLKAKHLLKQTPRVHVPRKVTNGAHDVPLVISVEESYDDASEVSLEEGLINSAFFKQQYQECPPQAQYYDHDPYIPKQPKSSTNPRVHHDARWGITTATLEDGFIDWPSDEEGGSTRTKETMALCAESFFRNNCHGLGFWDRQTAARDEEATPRSAYSLHRSLRDCSPQESSYEEFDIAKPSQSYESTKDSLLEI